MALFKYFKHTDDKARSILPDPQGLLSATVPFSRIEAVNTMVKPVIEEQINGNCSKKSSMEGSPVLPRKINCPF